MKVVGGHADCVARRDPHKSGFPISAIEAVNLRAAHRSQMLIFEPE
jgi:hypothetical protein